MKANAVMELREYLLSFGNAAEFGRFRTTTPFEVSRGDRVVVRSQRGLELARVLCEATAGHARFLPNTTLGKLLRTASDDDEQRALAMQERGTELFHAARAVVEELRLPLEVLDAEMMIDGKQAVLSYLGALGFDERELLDRLSRRFGTQIVLQSLALPREEEEEEEHGCGRPDCGRTEEGQCSSCGTGGCGSCGDSSLDMKAYFSSLRDKMNDQQRTPLV
jgi:cell fate regulator YaaT (PSP1 superfamily)